MKFSVFRGSSSGRMRPLIALFAVLGFLLAFVLYPGRSPELPADRPGGADAASPGQAGGDPGAGDAFSDASGSNDPGEASPTGADPDEDERSTHATEDYPVLTRADRVDMEGQPAPRIERGRNQRRVLDTHVDHEVARDNPEPIRPFGQAQPARGESPFAHDRYAKRAVEVGMSHRLFHEAARGERHRMVVPLTENEEVTVDLEKVVTRGPHTFSFVGKVEEHPDSAVVLVYNEGTITGDISLYGETTPDSRHFGFQAMEEGLVAVRELDAAAVHEEECGTCGEVHGEEIYHDPNDPLVTGESSEEEPMAEPAGDEVANTVDVVVGYGQEARIADGGVSAIEARIIASVDRMNLSFANSQVSNTQLVLLGMVEDPDYEFKGTESDSMNDELNDLSNSSDGSLDTVSDLKSALGADLISFVVKDVDGSAGVAWRPGTASIVARTYMTNTALTFVHELGHNFGLKHSWGDNSGSDSETTGYNYGWRYKNGSTKRRSVMAYDWDWQRTMYFSNPAVTHPDLGVATGAVDGYDATGDDTTDSRYVSGGYTGSAGAGFDGSNPDLGARNADYLFENSHTRASLVTRASLGVTRPASGEVVPFGESYLIEWVGGAYEDNLDIELLKGGAVVETLATESLNGDRVYDWNPDGLAKGEDYRIRLTLNGGEEVAESSDFTIDPDYPRVVDTFVSSFGIAEPGLTEVSVTFNRSMDPASFDAAKDVARFIGPDGSDLSGTFTGFTWSESDTRLTFAFSELTDVGFYRIDFGPEIEDMRGFAMDQNGNDAPGEIDDGFGFTFRVSDSSGESGTVNLLDSSFDTNPGFTLDSGWEVGAPAQGSVGGPDSAFTGDQVMGTYLSGNYPSGVDIYATSESFDMTGASNITLSFRRWLGLHAVRTGSPSNRSQDYAAVQYSVNGGSWIGIWNHNNDTFDDGGWSALQSIVLPAEAEDQADVRVRFWLSTESSQSYGWNLDDLALSADFESTFPAPPAPKVVGHMPAGAVLSAPSALWIDFDQPMDTGSFSLEDIVSFDGPSGALSATGFAWVDESRLRIDFDQVTEEGSYLLTLGTGVLNEEGDSLEATYGADFDYGVFDPPVIVTESLPMAHEGAAYSAVLEASSPDGLSLDLSVSGRPAWLQFSDQGDGTGTLSGTPPEGETGPLSLTFVADDSANQVEETFSLEINQAPQITVSVPTQNEVLIPEGVLLLVEGTVSDDGQPGSGLAEAWTVVSAPDGATVTFTPDDALDTSIAFDTAGIYELRYSVDDGALTSVYDLTVETGATFDGGGNTASIPSEDLAVQLPLDESSGSVASDDSGNGRDAQLQGSPVWQPEGGPRGGALEFTDSGQYGDVQNSADLNNSQQMSWSFWLNPADDNGDVRGILGKREGTSSGQDWAFFLWDSNELTVDIGSNRHGISSIPAGTWKHVTVVFDGTLAESERLKVYYDGQLETTKSESASSIPSNSPSVTLGLLEGNDGNFQGLMSEVLIYHGRALSAEDVGGIFEGGPGNVGPLVGAGAPRTVDLSETVTLAGSVEDDGLPETPGTVVSEWVQLSGPGSVSFEDTTLPDSGISFPESGSFDLRLTAFDGEIKTAHDTTYTVEDALEAPEVTEWPTAGDLVYGQTLSESTLTGGEASVPGTFAFTDPATIPDAGTAMQSVTFTPEDTEMYSTVTGEVSVTVDPAPATVALSDLSQRYTAAAKTPTVTTDPAGLSVDLSFDGDSAAPVDAGSYEVVATVSDPNFVGGSTDTLDIQAADLTVTADDVTKSEGDPDPALTWAVTSGQLYGDDTLSGTLTRDAGETVGTYPIRQGTLTAGGNYALAFVEGTLSIVEEQIFSVSYDANGGTGDVPAGGEYAEDSLIEVEFSPEPSRSGFDFMGWKTDPDGDFPEYTADGVTSFTLTEDVVLYAHWSTPWALQEDFEYLVLGDLPGQNGWTGDSSAQVIDDPDGSANQVLRFAPGNNESVEKTFSDTIPGGSVSTVYYRFRVPAAPSARINQQFRLTDHNTMRIKYDDEQDTEGDQTLQLFSDDMSTNNLVNEPIDRDTWYHFWLVLDGETGVYEVWTQKEGTTTPVRMTIGDDSPDLYTYSNTADINNLIFIGWDPGEMYYDDISLVNGVKELSIPPYVETVSVVDPPVITTQPTSQTVQETETLTLSVIADGEGPLSYQWRKDGVELTGANGSDLLIDPVGLDDAGDYAVRVSNEGGTTESDLVTISVEADPYQQWLRDYSLEDDSQTTVIKDGREVSLEEAYLLGSDPNDPEDVIRITETLTEAEAGQMQIHFPSLPDRVYTIEVSDDLAAENWVRHGDELIQGDGETQSFTVPMDSSQDPRLFYRVKVSFPE
ncbi:MAG: MBG domain-containing protein [Opitutales bacterium]